MTDPIDTKARELLAAEWRKDADFGVEQTLSTFMVNQIESGGWDKSHDLCAIREALRTAPEGYVLMPLVPTEKILDSLFDRDLTGAHDDDLRAAYDAVIAAAMEGR